MNRQTTRYELSARPRIGIRSKARRMVVAGASALAMLTAVAASSSLALAAETFPTMNDAGGIYWRSAPDWNTPIVQSGNGFYPGTNVSVQCYQSGTSVPGSSNTMWVRATWVSGPGRGSGWMNEHFVNDGAPINQAAPGIPQCGQATGGGYSGAPGFCATGCAIQSKANGLYVSAELSRTGSGYGTLRARASSVAGWEMYRIVGDCSSTAGCAIQSLANGLYVSAELAWTGNAYGTLRARASVASTWEKFNLVGDCTSSAGCALRSAANGLYVSSELAWTGDAYGTLRARASVASTWEHFNLVPLPNSDATANAAAGWASNQVGKVMDSGLCLTFVFQAWSSAGVNLRPWVTVPINSGTYPVDIWGHFNHGTTGTGTPPIGALVFFASKSGEASLSHVVVSEGGSNLVSTTDSINETYVHRETMAQRSYSIYLGWWLPE
jgi:hypothetical protein